MSLLSNCVCLRCLKSCYVAKYDFMRAPTFNPSNCLNSLTKSDRHIDQFNELNGSQLEITRTKRNCLLVCVFFSWAFLMLSAIFLVDSSKTQIMSGNILMITPLLPYPFPLVCKQHLKSHSTNLCDPCLQLPPLKFSALNSSYQDAVCCRSTASE